MELYTNEPSDCRYSTEDEIYNEMENEMNCVQEITSFGPGYWYTCNTTITDLTKKRFYFRCMDQPWLNESEDRNVMQESYDYLIKDSESELSIDYISPEGTIKTGEGVGITLEVLTSGGAENGKAVCEYGLSEDDMLDMFYYTGDSAEKRGIAYLHKQKQNPPEGTYTYYVKCVDDGGNEARAETTFTIDADNEAPKITRAYYDGALRIMTDEPATCAYSLTDTSCSFEVENATLMSGETKEHSADWQTDATYYIKCKDVYGREPGNCNIVVRAYDII